MCEQVKQARQRISDSILGLSIHLIKGHELTSFVGYVLQIQGRAEPARLALVLGKIDFEDERFSTDDWKALQSKMPYKAVPVMEVDDKLFAQSHAMLRFAGKLASLYPSDELSAFLVDEVVDTVSDLTNCMYRYVGPDDKQRRQNREIFARDDIPRYWGGLEARLNNTGAGPFVLGDQVSIADISIFCLFTVIKQGIIDHVPKDILDEYCTLKGVYDAFWNIPEVQQWYEQHPIPNVNAS